MRLKTAVLSLLALLSVGLSFAADIAGPAGRFISVGGSIDLLGDVNTAGKGNGNCLTYNSSTGKWIPGVCGSGGGLSALSINSGGVQISSPTQVLNFSSSTFNVAQGPVGTSTVTLNFSSVTAVGNVFNAANKLLLLDGTGKVSNSLLSASVSLFGDAANLATQTNGNYVQSVTSGPGVSISPSSPGHGTQPVFSLAPGTLAGDQSWADGTANSVTWRWVVPGVAPRLAFSDNLIQTLSELDAPTFVGTTMTADTISAGLSMTSGGKNVAQYSTTVIAGSTVAYSSGTIQTLNTTTLKFNDGTTMTTASAGGGGTGIIAKSTYSVDMNGNNLTNAALVQSSSFSVTGATETIFGTTYVRASSTTVGSGQKLLVYTAAAGKMTESIQDIITNGMTTTSTDTKSGAIVMLSSFTLPSVSQMGNPASAGQLAYSTSTAGPNWGGTVLYDGKQRMNGVMTATDSIPLAGWVPTYDATGRVLWEAQSGSGGAGTPGGSNTQIQFNNAGVFNGVAVATYNATTQLLTYSSGSVHVNVSSETFNNVRLVLSGTSAIQYPDGTVQTSSPTAGGGGGGSSVAVSTNGSIITSAASKINFKAPFTGSLNGSTTADITLDPSSATLQGNTFNGTSQLLQLNGFGNVAITNLGSGTNAVSTTAFFGDGTWSNGPVSVSTPVAGDSIRWNLMGRHYVSGVPDFGPIARFSGEVIGANPGVGSLYGDAEIWSSELNGPTLVPVTRWKADISTGSNHMDQTFFGRSASFSDGVNETHNFQASFVADSSTANVIFGTLYGTDRFYFDKAIQATKFYGDGSSLTGITGGGASPLAVTTGTSTGFVVAIASPAAVINFSSDTFIVSLTGGATAYVQSKAVSLSTGVAGTLSGSSVSGGTFGAVNGSALTNLTGANVGSGVPAANIATGSLGSQVIASSIAISGVTADTYGNATNVSSVTIGADGRVTGAANVAIAISGTAVSGGTFGAVNGSALTHITAANIDAGTLGATVQVSSLAAVVTAGSYGSATVSPTITFNAQGQIIGASSNTISGSGYPNPGNADLNLATFSLTNANSITFVTSQANYTMFWSTVAYITTSTNTTSASTVTATGLSFPIAANEVVKVHIFLNTGCNNTSGIKVSLEGPAGATGVPIYWKGNSSATTTIRTETDGLGTLTGAFGLVSSQGTFVEGDGIITNSSTAGTIKLCFSAATAAQTATINPGSYIDIRRVK